MLLTRIFEDVWLVSAVIDDRGSCQVKEALDALARDDKTAHAELVALLERIARSGPPRDIRRSGHLDGDVFELKTPRGCRLFYFFRPRRLVVCVELRRKPKPRALAMIIRRVQHQADGCRTSEAAGSLDIDPGG